MRILFDQGTPVPLRDYLPSHQVATTFEMGWSQLTNGDLLHRAEQEFDLFVTTDKHLRYQQNVASRRLAIVVLPHASWPKLQEDAETIAAAIGRTSPGDYVEL